MAIPTMETALTAMFISATAMVMDTEMATLAMEMITTMEMDLSTKAL